MCAWVLTIAFTVSLWRPSKSMMRWISSPGSSTSASWLMGSPMIEQLHCSKPTGMEKCRNFCGVCEGDGFGILADYNIRPERKRAERVGHWAFATLKVDGDERCYAKNTD